MGEIKKENFNGGRRGDYTTGYDKDEDLNGFREIVKFRFGLAERRRFSSMTVTPKKNSASLGFICTKREYSIRDKLWNIR